MGIRPLARCALFSIGCIIWADMNGALAGGGSSAAGVVSERASTSSSARILELEEEALRAALDAAVAESAYYEEKDQALGFAIAAWYAATIVATLSLPPVTGFVTVANVTIELTTAQAKVVALTRMVRTMKNVLEMYVATRGDQLQ